MTTTEYRTIFFIYKKQLYVIGYNNGVFIKTPTHIKNFNNIKHLSFNDKIAYTTDENGIIYYNYLQTSFTPQQSTRMDNNTNITPIGNDKYMCVFIDKKGRPYTVNISPIDSRITISYSNFFGIKNTTKLLYYNDYFIFIYIKKNKQYLEVRGILENVFKMKLSGNVYDIKNNSTYIYILMDDGILYYIDINIFFNKKLMQKSFTSVLLDNVIQISSNENYLSLLDSKGVVWITNSDGSNLHSISGLPKIKEISSGNFYTLVVDIHNNIYVNGTFAKILNKSNDPFIFYKLEINNISH